MVLNKITLSELEKIAAERDSLLCKIKEYEKLLEEKPDSAIQYINNVTVPFYQFSLDLKKLTISIKQQSFFVVLVLKRSTKMQIYGFHRFIKKISQM